MTDEPRLNTDDALEHYVDDAVAEEQKLIDLAYKGWPGDGSGMDDFADFNANEADDYRDE